MYLVRSVCLSLLATFFVAFTSQLHAQTLTRGPYLQMGSTSAITVRWRTSTATDTVVHYGTSATALSSSASSGVLTTEHQLRLTGLAPNTLYYYSVGSSTATLASGAGCFFVTAPTAAKATRVWVLGDAGNATSGQKAVRDAYYKFTGTRHTDLWLMLGDNAYMNGTDAQYQYELFDVYTTMLRRSVLWPTFGNHDAESADAATQTGPYFDWTTLPKNAEAGGIASGTEAYYSFDYGNIHFVCLDSSESSRSPTGPMLTWLKKDLAANRKEWTVAFWHHPPYSKGSHNSDTETELIEMRKNAVSILESYGVDLVLCGHSHSYERSYFINGHYGLSSTFSAATMIVQPGDGRTDGGGAYAKATTSPTPYSGAAYVVAGSSAHITTTGTLNHPAMYKSTATLGSVVLDFNGDQLDVQFLDSTGARKDYFTLRKNQGTADVAPTVAITSPTTGSTTSATSLTVTASAKDSDGVVTRVDLYEGTALLGSSSNSSCSFVWNNIATGTHTLTAKATDDRGLTGASAPVQVTVTSTAGTSNAVTSVTLINADTDQPIAGYEAIPNGAVIARTSLPTTHLNLRANTSPAIVGSVKLTLDGTSRTETSAPYALFGDTSGNYNAGTIANGTHAFTGTPYTLASGGGTAGTPLKISFTIQ
jgi:hypothetical protein